MSSWHGWQASELMYEEPAWSGAVFCDQATGANSHNSKLD